VVLRSRNVRFDDVGAGLNGVTRVIRVVPTPLRDIPPPLGAKSVAVSTMSASLGGLSPFLEAADAFSA
jgi:hypothetical protein